jgi:two-component system, OmpR family, KDP operon response regulator KdpE
MATMLSLRELTRQFEKLEERMPSLANGDEGVLTTGDFRIDLGSHYVVVKGHELHLDEEEFELLVFLTGHHTNIITPHTRLTTRWGREHVRQSDFLRVLANLQRKLESIPGAARYIRTEPWMVCRFDPGNRIQ